MNTDLDWCVDTTLLAANTAILRYPPLAEKSVAEFFAGIGLMRIGLENRGWRVKFANDFDPEKKEMYEGHFGSNTHLHLGDVHKLDVSKIPTVTLATASFPCNDLSLAGARNGLSGKNSSAFWGFFKLLKQLGARKPPLILIENVPGLVSSNEGKDLRKILLALNGLGYATDLFVVDASHFVPQSRVRLFIMAVSTSLQHSLVSPDLNIRAENALRPKLISNFIRKNSDLLWYFRNLPELPHRSNDLASILEEIPKDSALWWDKDRKEYLFNQFSSKHAEVAREMVKRDKLTYGTVFRRIRAEKSMAELRTDEIAGCLRTPRGGSGRQILFRAGAGQYDVRLLTPRECARLMGASNFLLPEHIRLNQALFGFGDAVCVPVVEWIADNYLNPLVNEWIRCSPNI